MNSSFTYINLSAWMLCKKFSNLITEEERDSLTRTNFEHTANFIYGRFAFDHERRRQIFRSLLANHISTISRCYGDNDTMLVVEEESAHCGTFLNLEQPYMCDFENHVCSAEQRCSSGYDTVDTNTRAFLNTPKEETYASVMHGAMLLVREGKDSFDEEEYENGSDPEIIYSDSEMNAFAVFRKSSQEKLTIVDYSDSEDDEDDEESNDFSELQHRLQLYRDSLVEDVLIEEDFEIRTAEEIQQEYEEHRAQLFGELPEYVVEENDFLSRLYRQYYVGEDVAWYQSHDPSDDEYYADEPMPLLEHRWKGQTPPEVLAVALNASEEEDLERDILDRMTEFGFTNIEERLLFTTEGDLNCQVHKITLDSKILAIELNGSRVSMIRTLRRFQRDLKLVQQQPPPGVLVLEDIQYPLDMLNINPVEEIVDGRFVCRAICPYGTEWRCEGNNAGLAKTRMVHCIVYDFYKCEPLFHFLAQINIWESEYLFKDLNTYECEKVTGDELSECLESRGLNCDLSSNVAPIHAEEDLVFAKCFQMQRGVPVHRWDLEEHTAVYIPENFVCIERKRPYIEIYVGLVLSSDTPRKLLAVMRYSERLNFDLVVERLRSNDYEDEVLVCDEHIGEVLSLNEATRKFMEFVALDIDIFTGISMRPYLHISPRAEEELASDNMRQEKIVGDPFYMEDRIDMLGLCCIAGVSFERLAQKVSVGRLIYIRDYHRNGHFFLTPGTEERAHRNIFMPYLYMTHAQRRYETSMTNVSASLRRSQTSGISFVPLLCINILWSWFIMWLIFYYFEYEWQW